MKWNVAISACCVALLAVNIALIHQNRQLKAQLALPPLTFEAPAGVQVPDLHGRDLNGQRLEVLYGKDPRKVLVLVFSPTCPFCDQNWPKWQQIILALDRSSVRPVAVDVTGKADRLFLSQHQLTGFPVFTEVDPRAVVDYRFHLTPQTILIDHGGKVEKVWTGVLNDSAVSELQHLLGGNMTVSDLHNNHPAF
ncbi:MAG TPA: redoxin domain-containing protein [Candidatus Angelobacter sp.]|nr:redoxin domain-containing protein [Candidatus Angelobacter sp.]